MSVRKSGVLSIREVIELLLRYPNQNTKVKAIYPLEDEIAIDTYTHMIYVDHTGFEEYKKKEDINVKLP